MMFDSPDPRPLLEKTTQDLSKFHFFTSYANALFTEEHAPAAAFDFSSTFHIENDKSE